MKVGLITEIISPYRIPVFNEIARTAGFDFHVIFLNASQGQRKWPVYWDDIKFSYEVLSGMILEGKNIRAIHVNLNIWSALMKGKFDQIIVGGWHQPAYYAALLYAKILRKRFFCWVESAEWDERSRNPAAAFLRKAFLKGCSGAIVPGKASRRYLISLGMRDAQIWTAPNAVDNDYFSRFNHREKNGGKTFLFVGRLSKDKGVYDLIEAFSKVKKEVPDAELVLCGEGPERRYLESYCKLQKLRSVEFTGFVSREELCRHYAEADVFVLPSKTEPWGLVINEAMNFGLPVLSSNHSGAAEDLVVEGENGFRFSPGDVDRLSSLMKKLALAPDQRKAFGRRSAELIKAYSPSACANGFLKAIRAAQAQSRRWICASGSRWGSK